MPIKSPPKERALIKMLLSAYMGGLWKDASLDWVEENQDGAVDVIATRADGAKLALEHTLIQPFVGEKSESKAFVKAFGLIEKNPALVLPERNLDVMIPRGYDWPEVGKDLPMWLVANHGGAPKEGECKYTVPVGKSSRQGPLQLNVILRTMHLPGMAGNCLICRGQMPADLGMIVEKALKTKLPKLANTAADRRILLLERDQIGFGNGQIYQEIVRLTSKFPDLSKIDEIWFANTAALPSEGWAYFMLMDGRGLELLSFQNGVLKKRRDDRTILRPPQREF